MGNEDSFMSALGSAGQNETIDFKGGYFSFAFGDEIAMVINTHFFILNCDDDLWEEVLNKIDETKDIQELKRFWIEKSKEYEISDWSTDFKILKKGVKND